MTLAIGGTSASSHRESHHGAVSFLRYDAVLLLHLRHELIEEEVLIVPSFHIEVATRRIVHIGASRIGHHYHHLVGLARGYQLVGHKVHATLVQPGGVVIAQAMQEIHDGIHAFGLAEAIGQIHVVLHPCTQHLALDRIGVHTAGTRYHALKGEQQHQHQFASCHIISSF